MTTVRVRVDDQEFVVDVGDLRARPVVAEIEGERFEIWPNDHLAAPAGQAPVAAPRVAAVTAHTVAAPIPGVVVSVAVRPGDAVAPGQELLAIEAMKMKNVIHAARAGQVAAVHVAPGQSVRHQQALIDIR
jgi:biotin carboxyl carrier protein